MKQQYKLWILIFLLALPIVFSAKYSISNDSWVINDKDQNCFTSICVLDFNVSNSKNQQRILPIEVFTNPKPSEIEIYKNVTIGWNAILNYTELIPENVTQNRTIYHWKNVPVKGMRWTDLNSSIVSGVSKGKSHKINTTGISFLENEIKQFKVTLKTVLAGITKFDILWHDPIINSTVYRGNFTALQDCNSTKTNVTISTDGRMISLGMT